VLPLSLAPGTSLFGHHDRAEPAPGAAIAALIECMNHAQSSSLARLALAALSMIVSTTLLPEADASSGRAEEASRFLTARFPLSADDLREVERGPVARTLEAADGREVATIGVATVGVPARFYIQQLQDISAFKTESPEVVSVGVFSNPATTADLAGLSLDSSELNDLRRCRPQACKVQLSVEAMDLIQNRLAAGGDDPQLTADRAFRAILVDLVNRYRERGDAALMTYADDERPLSVRAEFQAMVGAPPAILAQLPPLHHHLTSFPRKTPDVDDVEDIVYWSKERLGPAVVVTVTHLAIARISDQRVDVFAAASKQIYGSQYFDSSLGITVVVDAGTRGGSPRSFLVYVNRSRIDALTGFWGQLKRAVVRSRTRAGIRKSLAGAGILVEKRFHGARFSGATPGTDRGEAPYRPEGVG
jgi:hypothetical protein